VRILVFNFTIETQPTSQIKLNQTLAAYATGGCLQVRIVIYFLNFISTRSYPRN
jgi:hypothetical protein